MCGQVCGQVGRWAGGQVGRWAGGQVGRWAGGQAGEGPMKGVPRPGRPRRAFIAL